MCHRGKRQYGSYSPATPQHEGHGVPGQYRKKNVVYLGEKCSGFYQPKGDFSSL